jgi:predicted RNA-binding protein with PUA domain
LTNKFTHEDDKTEFKLELNDKLEKEVVAFLNSPKGGDIYIGVADDGSVVGVENIDKSGQVCRNRQM